MRGTLPRFRIDQLMAFAWKMLMPMSFVNIVVVAAEVLVWQEWSLHNDWILVPFAVINLALAVGMLMLFFRVTTAALYRLPRRVILVSDIQVPSLPAPAPATLLPPRPAAQ